MAPLGRQLGKAEGHRHAVLHGALEQRPRRRIRHLALEPEIGLGAVLVMPAREEGGQRKLGIDDEVGLLRGRLIHQLDHAGDDDLAAVVLLDRPELGGGDADVAHGCPSTRSSRPQRSGEPGPISRRMVRGRGSRLAPAARPG